MFDLDDMLFREQYLDIVNTICNTGVFSADTVVHLDTGAVGLLLSNYRLNSSEYYILKRSWCCTLQNSEQMGACWGFVVARGLLEVCWARKVFPS